MEGKVKYEGLSETQVQESRRAHGENRLSPAARKSSWRLYLMKFRDPMILILLLALVLSFAISAYKYLGHEAGVSEFFEPLGILVAVILSTGIAFYFERKADREFNLLNQVNDSTLYKAMRGGSLRQVPKHDLVVGDVVFIETGEEIPADGELLEAVSLQVNESSLTGELEATKYADAEHNDPEATYPSNWVYRGTSVTAGHGVMLVRHVGDATESGKVFKGIQVENEVETPLNRQLVRLATLISRAGYVLAGLLIAVRVWTFFHQNGAEFDWLTFGVYLLNTFMLAVTLLVVAVPEGLPMSISLSLAYSMRSMMRTNNLVRKMHACETMGATTVICTDKTGTLTQNQMRVHALMLSDADGMPAPGPARDALVECMAVNSTAYLEREDNGRVNVLGNPTEGALLLWLQGEGVDYLAERARVRGVDQLTFSTERKYMATLIEDGEGRRRLLLKGAPDIVRQFCSSLLDGRGAKIPLEGKWEEIRKRLEGYQMQGMRTLALAHLEIGMGASPFFAEGKLTVSGFTLLGLVAINDPVRDDVAEAIAECRAAGISVKIVTGDTILTTREIARQIGLWDDACTDRNAMSGPEFAAMRDEEVLPRLRDLVIMYRARPLDKARLTHLLQSQGEVVAVTGDGTNDAPALRAAHVGLSMGDGTSVAKEASDMTILDNSFVSIGQGVLWGRSLYQNIQRFVVFQLTINVAACLIVLIGAFFGTESPLTITQMLWINLIMDTFAALALASLPPDRNVMRRMPRRREEFIITRQMRGIILGVGIAFVAVLLGLMEYLKHFDVTKFHVCELPANLQQVAPKAPPEVSVYELSIFFSLFVFLQVWNLFNARAYKSEHSALHALWRDRRFLGVVGLIAGGQILLMNVGGAMFNIVRLSWDDQLFIILVTSLVLWIGEAIRGLSRLRAHRRRAV